MSTILSDILKPALRRAGITSLPGITPSSPQYTELMNETNRMLGSWNLDGHKIYTTSIDRYALTPQQTTYFIGPTGDFVAPRPLFIRAANLVVVSSSPELHIPMKIVDDMDWSEQVITELAVPWPWKLYNDGSFPDSKLYLYGFPTEANDLELYTWLALKTDFTDVTDAADFPPGYEDALVTNLAVRAVALYPKDTPLNAIQRAELRTDSGRALEAVQILNTRCPKMVSEAAGLGGPGNHLPVNSRSQFFKWGGNL